MKRIWLVVAALVGIGLVVVAVFAATSLLREPEPPPAARTLQMPLPGEVRPDYLEDGTPVWVVGHADGSVSVLSTFDTHHPFNVGKVVWWCPTAQAFENPEHGARYDEYGLYVGGPASSGLPSYETAVEGSRLLVGALREPPAFDEPFIGLSEFERNWCTFPEDGVIFHRFDGWKAWNSPTEAVAAAPDGWVLINGSLALLDNQVVLCARTGCADAVAATNIQTPPNPEMEFGPFFGERWIARVRDGALTDVTRVMPIRRPDASQDRSL